MEPPDPGTASRLVERRRRRTCALLSISALLVLIVFSPELLVGFGLLGADSLQASATLTAIMVGFPAFFVPVAVAGFSIAGLIHGPARLRLHVRPGGSSWPAVSPATSRRTEFGIPPVDRESALD